MRDRGEVLLRRFRRDGLRVREHLLQYLAIERAQIDRDLRRARHRRDEVRLDLDHAARRDDARPRVLARVLDRDLAAAERELGRGEERVLAQVDRRGAGVRGLTDELEAVALDAHRAEHDADRLLQLLEHRPLLDVELEIRDRLLRLEVLRRRLELIEIDPVLGERIWQLHARAIDEVSELSTRIECTGGRRGAPQRPPEPCAFFIGPVDEVDRQLRLAMLAQDLEPGEPAEAALEPAAAGHGIEVAADHEALRRLAADGRPQISRRIALGRDAALAELRGEPLAGLAPRRSPRGALGAALVGGQLRELLEVRDHPRRGIGDLHFFAPSRSTAMPIACMPLSTSTVAPVLPLASGLHRNAAVVPTSRAVIDSGSGPLRFA